MVNSEKQQSMDNREVDEVEKVICVEESEESISISSSSDDASSSSVRTSGVSEELTEISVDDEGGDDLFIRRSDREIEQIDVFQCFQALDWQVLGACRADERLKPLLKLNVSAGAAEDRLLSHLSQHFEPSEVGMLARCLCIPLVSIRVGKIKKQGTLLCPTATRGNLNLTILPTSELRISFIGDDGRAERVATFCSESHSAAVEIKDIVEDKSGRSFLINMPDGETSYFWCSEKSKLLGDEMRRKMKDLLKKKPSLAELTGISESRLDCFAIHLRAYLIGSAVTNAQASSVLSTTLSKDGSASSSEHGLNAQISVASLKPMQSQQLNGQGSRTIPLHLSNLTSRSSSLSESLLRNSPSVGVSKDRLRLHDDSYLSCTDGQTAGTASSTEVPSSTCVEEDKLLTETSTSNILEPLFPTPSFLGSSAAIPPLVSSVFSPYYCWCPPSVSTLQYTVGTPHLPFLSADSLSLPQLSSILPAQSSSISTSRPPFVTDASALNFPPLLPEPLIRLPSSLPALQQIPTFTPLMCDPIVHIPVMDVYSSGQGYLVSAGPAISSTIPPLHSNFVNPLIPETESMVEKSARETLRLLINSSNQPNPQLINVLPSVLSRSEEVQNMLAAGRRGIYSGTIDLDAFANGFATRGLVSLSGGPVDRINQKQVIKENVEMEKPESSGECLFDKDFIDYEQGGES